MLSIDTPVFVSAFGIPDEYTEKSRNFFSALSAHDQVVLSVLAQAETVVVLGRQNPHNSPDILKYLQQFFAVPIDQNLLNKSLKYLPGNALKASDFLIAATAALHHALLVTWDKQLLSSTNTLCQTLTPKQFIERHSVV